MKVTFQIVHNVKTLMTLFSKQSRRLMKICAEKSDEELKSLYEVKYNMPLKNSKSIVEGLKLKSKEFRRRLRLISKIFRRYERR